MPGYKLPCRYCDKVVPPDSKTCPFCGRINPTGSLRCPKCRSPIQKDWKACSHCGLPLETICPKCGKTTFLVDYCEHCGAQVLVYCQNPKCQAAQTPIGNKCVKCGKPLKLG